VTDTSKTDHKCNGYHGTCVILKLLIIKLFMTRKTDWNTVYDTLIGSGILSGILPGIPICNLDVCQINVNMKYAYYYC